MLPNTDHTKKKEKARRAIMSEKISRRNFLRTATLGAAAAGLLAGCGSASSSTAAGT